MSESDLHSKHFQEGVRLHSLLIGAAGSAIAFALHETSDRRLEWSLVPTILAILAWGASFMFGILSRKNVIQAIRSNALLVQARSAGSVAGVNTSQEYLDRYNARGLTYQNFQEWLLLFGVILYISGHFWHLAELPQHEATKPMQVTASTSPAR